MKFGLFTLQSTDHLVRCIDGKLSLIDTPAYVEGSAKRFDSYVDAPEIPAKESELEIKLRNQGTLLTSSRSVAAVLYGVPDDVELYTAEDGMCKL